MEASVHHPASYRDPSGFVFKMNDRFYRQVNLDYAADYDLLMGSGLYAALTEKGLLVPHVESAENLLGSDIWYKTLLPEQLPLIGYAYEWGFDQLRDAALLTLRVARIALRHGMVLKDATPFNVQFLRGKPVFIDTLSFERFDASKPWVAYRQFCETFLVPLLMKHYRNVDAQQWLRVYLDGIPISLAASLLPRRSRFNLGVYLHVFLQSRVQKKSAARTAGTGRGFGEQKFKQLLGHLRTTVEKLHVPKGEKTTWNNYYEETILSRDYLREKEEIVSAMTADWSGKRVMDLGCNDGYFSQRLARAGAQVIAVDFDASCINRLYLACKTSAEEAISPLCVDLSNPPAAGGFRNRERASFLERVEGVDGLLALALIHHLVLGRNIPLDDVADLFASMTRRRLVVEFVPLDDEKSQQLIAGKDSYHEPYDAEAFERAFLRRFTLLQKKAVPGTKRLLYQLEKNS